MVSVKSNEEKEQKALTLSPVDAEEYRAYKKERKMMEILSAMARSESMVKTGDDAVRVMTMDDQ